MKVYAHYEKIGDIEYRWRTLIQIGNSWDVCGTVVMKNPGSSRPINVINDSNLLNQLSKFDNADSYLGHDWYEFTIDNTMGLVSRLIESYRLAHNRSIEGVIQIFNLFNIRDVDLNKALEKTKVFQDETILMTTNDDINNLVSPIYLGWGNLKNNINFKENAIQFFEVVKQGASYLDPEYSNNSFYHPQYLLVYGRNKERCRKLYYSFINDKL